MLELARNWYTDALNEKTKSILTSERKTPAEACRAGIMRALAAEKGDKKVPVSGSGPGSDGI